MTVTTCYVWILYLCIVFFCKQKTAYEMRISDWSSDVCSSDLAYEGAARMDVPGELAAALAGNRKAKAFFDTLDRTNRYAFCWRVQTAKKPETRVARAEKFVAVLARGEKLHG